MKSRYQLQSARSSPSLAVWISGLAIALLLSSLIASLFLAPKLLHWRSQKLLAQAQGLAQAGAPIPAARRAEAAYRLSPENLDALRLAATSLAESDPAAAQRLTLELAADPRASEADLLQALPALAKLPVADFERLLSHLPEGVRNAPEQLSQLAHGWAEAGQPDKAATYARRYLELRPDPTLALRLGTQLATHPTTQAESVRWLIQAIQTGGAEEIFPAFQILNTLPPQAVAPEQLTDFAAILQKLPGATPEQIWQLRQIELGLHPDRQAAVLEELSAVQKKLPRTELAQWLISLNEPARLIEWITPREAIADPTLFDAYAQALLKANRQDELLALLPNAPAVSPEITAPLLAWLHAQKQTARLRQLAEWLLERSPDNANYLNLVAYLRFLKGELGGPWMEKMETLVKTEPANQSARTTLALGYLKSKNAAKALGVLSPESDSHVPLTDADKVVRVCVWFQVGKKPEARALLSGIRVPALLPEEENLLIKP